MKIRRFLLCLIPTKKFKYFSNNLIPAKRTIIPSFHPLSQAFAMEYMATVKLRYIGVYR